MLQMVKHNFEDRKWTLESGNVSRPHEIMHKT